MIRKGFGQFEEFAEIRHPLSRTLRTLFANCRAECLVYLALDGQNASSTSPPRDQRKDIALCSAIPTREGHLELWECEDKAYVEEIWSLEREEQVGNLWRQVTVRCLPGLSKSHGREAGFPVPFRPGEEWLPVERRRGGHEDAL